MAVPHYAYLVLKMPSPAGVLALWVNLSITYACETVPADDLEIPLLEPPRASTKSKETKEVGLGLDDPSKTLKIGAHLDPK